MKIINNRYKVDKNLYNDFFVEAYRVIDLEDGSKFKFLKLYYFNLQQEFIDYLTSNQFLIRSIKHKNLLLSEEFNIIKSIDLRDPSSLMYYSVSEYTKSFSLSDSITTLNLKERIKVLLDVMMVVDYLHFRGISYKFLSPMQIFIENKNEVKLESLYSVIEKHFSNDYSQFESQFISPDLLSKNITSEKSLDYFSLAKLIAYLFNDDEEIYKNYKSIKEVEEIKKFFKEIIKALEYRGSLSKEIDLINYVDKIIDFFNFDYTYDLVQERDFLFLESPIIVRKGQLKTVIDFDEKLSKKTNSTNLILIDGDEGIGKDRFLKEVKYRLELKGRSVYSIDVDKATGNEYLTLVSLLAEMRENTPNSLKEKYKNEILQMLPAFKKAFLNDKVMDATFISQKYRFYNRMASYLKDLSLNKPIYVLVNNIQSSSQDFLTMLNYLASYFKNSQVICIFAYNSNILSTNNDLKLLINSWSNNYEALEIILERFALNESADLLKNTLGIGEIVPRYAQYLIQESGGKPEEILKIIEYLYKEGYLYMHKKGRWTLDISDDSQLIIPSTTDEHIIKQLKMLEVKYKEPLEMLSCFSEFAPRSILETLCKEDQLDAVLTYLLQANILEKRMLDFELGYSFNSIQLKKRVYSEISKDKKLDYHTQIAVSLKQYEIIYHNSIFDELIYQLIRSNQSDFAIIEIIRMVDSLDNKSGEKAKALLENAFKILPYTNDIDIILDVYQRILYIELLLETLEEDNQRYQDYIILGEKNQSQKHILHAKLFQAELNYQKDDKTLFINQVEEIRQLNKEYRLVYFDVYCLTLMSNILIVTSKYDQAKKDLDMALSMAHQYKLKDQLGNIYNMLGVLAYLKSDYKIAIKHFDNSYKYFMLDKDLMRANKPINNLGNIYVTYFNDLDMALESYQKGLDISTKHQLKKMQVIFNVNISEVYKEKYEYKKALSYILEANRVAISISDNHKMAICQNLMGSTYLELQDYSKAYESFIYERDLYSQTKASNLQLSLAYYNFTARFYSSFGDWDKSITYYKKSEDLYKQIDKRQYYKIKFKILLTKYLKNEDLAKENIDEFINEYRQSIYVENYREAVLTVALLSLQKNNKERAKKYLALDDRVKGQSNVEYLNDLRLQAEILLNINKENLKVWKNIYKKELSNKSSIFEILILNKIANLSSQLQKNQDAVTYYIKSLEILYKNTIEIPGWDLKISYLKSRDSDYIKDQLEKILKAAYNLDIDSSRLDNFSEKEDFEALNQYFDFAGILTYLKKEKYSHTFKSHINKKVKSIDSLESLLLGFNVDHTYNLDLLINFIAKETLASQASIITYSEKDNKYNLMATTSKNQNNLSRINENIFKLAARSEIGLLARYDFESFNSKLDTTVITDGMSATMCVAIRKNNKLKNDVNRLNQKNSLDDIIGYIYLESESVFNNFNEKTLKLVNSLAYLAYQNIEMQKLKLLATTDKLTGALTRKYFEQKFVDLVDNKKADENTFSILMLDLDHFKKINDNYGHQKGDEVLNQVSRVIRDSIRSFDIFARYGGEEFIIILKDTSKNEALLIAERIRASVEGLIIKGINYPLTISIGLSHYPSHSKFKDDLVQKADQALYHSKQKGRNKVFLWNQEMDNVFQRADKLAGVLTGIGEVDNKNVLGIIQVAQLVEEDQPFSEKIFTYLGELINLIEARNATLILLDSEEKVYFSRNQFSEGFVSLSNINETLVDEAIKSKNGQFIIDWDSIKDTQIASQIPNWNSLIIIPMIKDRKVVGLTYLSSPLSEKEFNFNDYNLAKSLVSIFTSMV